MQPRASIMQVEHAVEVPNDPRPNAFYDNGTGTMRVYHGPAYGNPSGVLYPKQVYNIKNTPVGVPHPTLNPWYNGFPSAGGPLSPQDVSPYIADRGPPPAGVDPIHWNNPWLAGYGMTGGRGPGPAPTTPTRPEAKKSGRHDKSPDITSPTPSRPRHKDRDAGWDSNVVPIPSVEVTAPDGSPAMRSDRSNRSGGSNKRTSQGVQDAGRSSKQSSSKRDPASKAVHSLGKVLQELALKEAADLSRRGQRWSDRSSSKEPSPQPGWDTTHQNSSNKNDNNHTKNGSNNGGAWNNTTNNNTGNADDWATTNNTNADAGGGGGSWDNAWGGDGNANNDTFANNDAGWGESSNNNGGNTNNNGDADWGNDGNNDTWNSPADNNADTNNEGEPSSPKLSPIPGTWNSPVASPIYSSASKDSNKVPSHTSGDNVIGEASSVNSKGSSKGKAKSSGPDWGDQSVAQDTGGFWGTEEGHVAEENSRQIKADRAKKARESSNGSWW
ncbi:hypothetical protein F5Y18DRAFT_375839 [Xylariaceae sp. FL1019]|nr:hypothetical protein F5Y18DRAFT_375839 [Xylariaceae sp. FL1019]